MLCQVVEADVNMATELKLCAEMVSSSVRTGMLFHCGTLSHCSGGFAPNEAS